MLVSYDNEIVKKRQQEAKKYDGLKSEQAQSTIGLRLRTHLRERRVILM